MGVSLMRINPLRILYSVGALALAGVTISQSNYLGRQVSWLRERAQNFYSFVAGRLFHGQNHQESRWNPSPETSESLKSKLEQFLDHRVNHSIYQKELWSKGIEDAEKLISAFDLLQEEDRQDPDLEKKVNKVKSQIDLFKVLQASIEIHKMQEAQKTLDSDVPALERFQVEDTYGKRASIKSQQIYNQAGDGNCLYHSLAAFSNANHLIEDQEVSHGDMRRNTLEFLREKINKGNQEVIDLVDNIIPQGINDHIQGAKQMQLEQLKSSSEYLINMRLQNSPLISYFSNKEQLLNQFNSQIACLESQIEAKKDLLPVFDPSLEGGPSLDTCRRAFLDYLGRDGNWGGSETLVVFASRYRTPVIVFEKTGRKLEGGLFELRQIQAFGVEHLEGKTPCYLELEGGNHYNWINPDIA